MIENLLKERPLVGQALAYGDKRPHVVALITLDGGAAPVWATEWSASGSGRGRRRRSP
nr:hypothetical protein GCM10010200_083500 [Actinomadura rugatobispora]